MAFHALLSHGQPSVPCLICRLQIRSCFPRRHAIVLAGSWLLVLAWVSAARPAIAQVPNAKVGEQRNSTATQPEIDRWIAELGSDSYPIRQSAAEQLLAAGMSARNALIQLADGADPETRAAARRLVSLIDRTEFRRSLDAFAADTDGQRGLTLPGWEAFQKLVGSDPACRTLFVDMQRQEGSLLATAFGISKKPPDELWEDRLQRVAQWQTSASERGAAPPLGSCAAMLFLGCSNDMNVSDSAATIVDILIQRSPVREALLSEKRKRSDSQTRCRLDLELPEQQRSRLAQPVESDGNILARGRLAPRPRDHER